MSKGTSGHMYGVCSRWHFQRQPTCSDTFRQHRIRMIGGLHGMAHTSNGRRDVCFTRASEDAAEKATTHRAYLTIAAKRRWRGLVKQTVSRGLRSGWAARVAPSDSVFGLTVSRANHGVRGGCARRYKTYNRACRATVGCSSLIDAWEFPFAF